jgi:UPF0716 protein FxsA
VIGSGWTIFAVVATAVIGVWLLRQQGFSTLQRAQLSIAQGQIPAVAMLEGVALIISGALLLTPGFFTDSIGFLLLIPIVRQALIKRAFQNGQFVYRSQSMHSHYSHGGAHHDSTIIEGELIDDDERRLR